LYGARSKPEADVALLLEVKEKPNGKERYYNILGIYIMPPALAPGEKVLLVGTYAVGDFSTYEFNMGMMDTSGNSAYGYVSMTMVERPLLKTKIHNSASVGASLNDTTPYLAEQYTANTFRRNLSRGQISWAANYPDPSGSIDTSGGVQSFMVMGKSGIYQNVTRVVIDFTNANRLVYFIQ